MVHSIIDALPLLNEWILALNLEILREKLYLRVKSPMVQYINAYTEKATIMIDTLVPVTDDIHAVLELLGFENVPDLIKRLNRCETQNMTCSLMCSSEHFHPSMANNTNYGKFSSMSPLTAYVNKSYDQKTIDNKKDHGAIQRIIYTNIVHKFPDVKKMKDAARYQAQILGELQVATWGRGLENVTVSTEDGGVKAIRKEIRKAYSRWTTFVRVYGVISLTQMSGEEVFQLWIKYRDDPLSHSHNWHCLTLKDSSSLYF
jgi:hypothetical protein